MTEPRRRYYHAAVDVSGLGANEPKADPASSSRDPLPVLDFSPQYQATLQIPRTNGAHKLGWVNQGVWWGAAALINHVALGAGTITLALQESSPGAADGITLITTGALTSAGPLVTTARYAPTTEPRILVATLASVVVSSVPVALSLLLNPTVPDWT